MLKASICVEMVFTELPFLDRIKKAAEIGYDAVEFWNWDNKDMDGVRTVADAGGIEVACFQANRGGTLIHPEHRDRVVAGVKASLSKAKEMGVQALFLLTDELGEDRGVVYKFPELTADERRRNVLRGLAELAGYAEETGVTLNLEALNTKVDHPGYWLDHSESGFALIRQVGSPRLRFLFDVYHMQVMEGDLISRMTGNIDLIGHVHVADVPGRHEPGTGEINYRSVLSALRDAGYDRYVGMEFAPTIPSERAAAKALELVKG